MIVVCGGIKGGSGKTTVATNLAVILSNEGRDALLVDADDQETAADFTVLRNDTREEGAGLHDYKTVGCIGSNRNLTPRREVRRDHH